MSSTYQQAKVGICGRGEDVLTVGYTWAILLLLMVRSTTIIIID